MQGGWRIKVLALDIDGVLTDGTTSVSSAGVDEKRLAFHDLDALSQARRAGMVVALVTGEEGEMVGRVAARCAVEHVWQGAKDKAAALDALCKRLGVTPGEVCYVGDGDRDAPALTRAGLGLAPANATPAAKAAARRVLAHAGGAGAVAEAVRLLLALADDAELAPALEQEARRIAVESLAAHERFLQESLPLVVQMARAIHRALSAGGKILLCGSGESAAGARHVADALAGRFLREGEPWPVLALTMDTSRLACVGNDWDLADVFARQVRAHVRAGDVVVGISAGGGSANVLRALDDARARGAVAIGFGGGSGGQLAAHCDLCFLAPASATPRIQELHLLAWHAICEVVEAEMLKGCE